MAEFDLKEILSHNTETDIWVVVHGQILDVTKYLSEHPGGAPVLLECAGKDATAAFEDAGHSEDAVEIMNGFLIGTLKGAKPRNLAPQAPQVLVPLQDAPTKEVIHVFKQQAIGLTIVAIGAVAAFGLSKNRGVIAGDAAGLAAHRSDWLNPQKMGFASGYLAASSVLALAALVGFRHYAPRFAFDGKVMQYPKTIKAQKSVKPAVISVRGFLEPKTYQLLPLVSKTEVAPGVYCFVFGLPTSTTVLGLPCGQHVAIRAEIEGQTVSRSYTPVSNNTDYGRLELIVRCYPDGLLTGKYLRYLKVGDEVEFRGPRGPMRYRNGLARRIGMIAGGTGITPMFQLIRAVCEDAEDLTEVSLIYANRSPQDMLLRQELDSFARRYPKNFKVWYMVDKAVPGWEYGVGWVSTQTINNHLPAPAENVKVLLCGPPGMVEGSKKNLVSLGFKEPGAVAKMADQIFLF